ncbi:MAG: amylo-alpha-1,6-glucosidase, partial [Candidatus Rokuibacteriota bacterium]
LERFRLDGTIPVWTYACGDVLVEKRVWMEQGASTTYVRYEIVRGTRTLTLDARALVNYRDYHALTHGGAWRMDVTGVTGGALGSAHGLRVDAFDGASPVFILAPGATAALAHAWFEGFQLAREAERGLDDREDHLHVATFEARLPPGRPFTFVLSTDADAPTDGEAALGRRRRHDAHVLATARAVRPGAEPEWIEQLTLAADQFVVARPRPGDPDGLTIIAGYPWFGDWGRDTMIALPGLALATGRPEIAARILRTFAAFVDRGMLPNRFPDKGETPEYNTVDATLWYFEAIRACHTVTKDDGLLKDLMPVLEHIVGEHVRGTRYGIGVDPADGLLRSGEPGVQLTWMDAKVGDWVVTPRSGKAVEINALWYNALRLLEGWLSETSDATGATRARHAADRVLAAFDRRFWNPETDCCFDVIDGEDGGVDAAIRPN